MPVQEFTPFRARSALHQCLKRCEAAGLSWPLPKGVDEAALVAQLYPAKLPAVGKAKRPKPGFSVVMRELGRKRVTRKQLWREYQKQHADGIKYTAFCVQHRAWRKTIGARRLAIPHAP